MLIHPYSDTHGHHHDLYNTNADVIVADVIVNAGDNERNNPQGRFVQCRGNHDFYRDDINRFDDDVSGFVEEYKDVVFIPCTLWTNFLGLEFIGDDRNFFTTCLNDFHFIKGMTPEKMIELFNKDFAYLKENVKKYKDKKVVIVTHFPPSKKAIHPKYEGDRLNRYFVNDLDDFILEHPQIKLWVFGHTHSSSDFKIGETRCICNPRGYKLEDGNFENPDFDPNLIIEI